METASQIGNLSECSRFQSSHRINPLGARSGAPLSLGRTKAKSDGQTWLLHLRYEMRRFIAIVYGMLCFFFDRILCVRARVCVLWDLFSDFTTRWSLATTSMWKKTVAAPPSAIRQFACFSTVDKITRIRRRKADRVGGGDQIECSTNEGKR